ncbi:MAG: DNA replication and repair protein RecF [Bacteroidetes bacterium]|nr:DNA replication and repair protein RecF [Bacteroidota bacterium]
MYLKQLTLTNFKNYSQASFTFSEKINCFIGNNGVGKTNLLDAIHYLSFCKSYFNPVDTQNIRHGEDFFALHGTYVRKENLGELVECIQKRNHRKKFLINRKEYDRLADHIGNIPLVMISPYDSDLINDGSEIRRKYIDSVISQFDKLYLDDLINYHKALFQRNALLKSFADNHRFDPISVETWDEQLVKFGMTIFEKRKLFLEHFIPVFQHFFRYISCGDESVDIIYQSQLLEGDFRELLSRALSRDKAAQFSTTGIHKDDLELLISGYPVKKFGSQGQQKSFVIGIRLAQFEYTQKVKGYKPLILLDDVFDKLDDLRVEQLVKLVSENSFGQIFITDTQEDRVKKIVNTIDINHKIFRITNAK